MKEPSAWRRRLRWLVVGLVITAALGCWAWDQAHVWLPGAVNLARDLPGVGFGRMHWLEQRALSWRDACLRRDQASAQARAPQPPPEALRSLWPPPPLLPLLKDAEPSEGAWSPASNPCLGDRAPEALYQTALRVDAQRPDVAVHILAMDLRRLRLAFVPGSEDAGPRGGVLDPTWQPDALLTFHGGFQTPHGGFGQRARGETLVPMRPGAATVGLRGDQKLWMGAWPDAPGAQAEGFVWLRQNLQPVFEGTKPGGDLFVVADGRREAIGHSPTRRAGLCVRGERALLYFWTLRAQAQALQRAMIAAGCEQGMHLDLNAFHTGLEFIDLRGARRSPEGHWEGACTQRMHDRMSDRPPGRHLSGAERDFFVVRARQSPMQAPVAPR